MTNLEETTFGVDEEGYDDSGPDSSRNIRSKRQIGAFLATVAGAVSTATAAISGIKAAGTAIVGSLAAVSETVATVGTAVGGVVDAVGASVATVDTAVAGVTKTVEGCSLVTSGKAMVNKFDKAEKKFGNLKQRFNQLTGKGGNGTAAGGGGGGGGLLNLDLFGSRKARQKEQQEVTATLAGVTKNGQMLAENSAKMTQNLNAIMDNRKAIEDNGKGIAANGRGIEDNHNLLVDAKNMLDRNLNEVIANRQVMQQARAEIAENGHAIDRNFEGIAQNWRSLERNYQALTVIDQNVAKNLWAIKLNSLGIAVEAAFIAKNGHDIRRNFNEIKKFEHITAEQFEVSLRHYAVIETGLRQALSAIEASKVAILDRIDLAEKQILAAIAESRTRPTWSALKTFFEFIIPEMREVNALPVADRVAKLERPDSVLVHLQQSRLPEAGTMFSHLSDIINQQMAVPANSDDTLAVSMLELLCYGTQVYTLIVTFLVQQYSLLAKHYYYRQQLDVYNRNYRAALANLNDFTHTLTDSGTGLLAKVTTVLSEVTALPFVRGDGAPRADIAVYAANAGNTFEAIRKTLAKLGETMQAAAPEALPVKLDFTRSNITTPQGRWQSGRKVSYAVQLVDRAAGVASLVSDWSTGYTIDDRANPVVSVGASPSSSSAKDTVRAIFRKFDNDPPELVAVLNDPTATSFVDIGRELFNAVAEPNPKLAEAGVALYLSNGADPNAELEHRKRPIHRATEDGNWRHAQMLIDAGADVNVADDQGHTPVYIATEAGNEQLVRNLVEKGNASLSVHSNDDHLRLTPLHAAAFGGHVGLVQYFLGKNGQNDVDVNALDSNGFTPLHYAAAFCHDPVVALLVADPRVAVAANSTTTALTPLHLAAVNNCANVTATLVNHDQTDLYARNAQGQNALHLAAAYGSAEVASALVDQDPGLCSERTTVGGLVPLHYAAMNGNKEVVTALSYPDALSARTDGDHTPLLMAAQYSSVDAARALLDAGADPNVRTSGHGSVMHQAAGAGDIYATMNLITSLQWVNQFDAFGREPLHAAIVSGVVEVANQLLRNGANPNQVDVFGTPVAHLAMSLPETTALIMLRILTGYEAKLFATNYRREQLLHLAAARGYYTVVRFLVDNGVDVTATKEDHETALHLAAAGGHLEVVRYLITEGADVNAPTYYLERTPLHYAITGFGSPAMVKLFAKQPKVQLDAADSHGDTAAMLAARHGRPDLARLLVHLGANAQAQNAIQAPLMLEACRSGSWDLIDYLATHRKVDVSGALDQFGRNCLHYALDGDSAAPEVIQKLIDAQVSLDPVDRIQGETLLHKAVALGRLEIAQLLYQAKPKHIDATNAYLEKPIHLAARNGHLKLAKFLLGSGPDSQANSRDVFGLSPLHSAVDGDGDRAMVDLLLGANATYDLTPTVAHRGLLELAVARNKTFVLDNFSNNQNVRYACEPHTGQRWVHCAAKHNNLGLLAKLIAGKPKVVDELDRYGRSVLYHAVAGDADITTVRYLFEHGATTAYDPAWTENPLYLALSQGKTDIATQLADLMRSEPMRAAGESGNTPLHAAIELQDTDWIARLLTTGRYQPEARNWAHQSPFDLLLEGHKERALSFLVNHFVDGKTGESMLHHLVAAGGSAANGALEYLLQRGAYVNTEDGQGNTPLHVAAMRGELQTVALLASWPSADLTTVNQANQTALDLATSGRFDEVANLLRKLAGDSEQQQEQPQQQPQHEQPEQPQEQPQEEQEEQPQEEEQQQQPQETDEQQQRRRRRRRFALSTDSNGNDDGGNPQSPDSPPHVTTSGGSRPSWWLLDVVALVGKGIHSVVVDKIPTVLWGEFGQSSTLNGSPSMNGGSTVQSMPSVDTNSALLLLNVLVRKFTGQSWYSDESKEELDKWLDTRAVALEIVERFESSLVQSERQTRRNSYESVSTTFQLFQAVERCLASGSRLEKLESELTFVAKEVLLEKSMSKKFGKQSVWNTIEMSKKEVDFNITKSLNNNFNKVDKICFSKVL